MVNPVSCSVTQALEFPLELTAHILKYVSPGSLLITQLLNKTWYLESRRVFKVVEKFTLAEGLIEAKCYKTAILTVKNFQLDEDLLHSQLIKKFEKQPSFELFLLIGLFRPLKNAQHLIFESNFSWKDPVNYSWIKSIKELNLSKIRGFLLTYENLGISFKAAVIVYQVYKTLYMHGLTERLETGGGIFFSLANPENPEYFMDLLKIVFEQLLAELPIKEEERIRSRIYLLAKLNPAIALFEFISNADLEIHKNFYAKFPQTVLARINHQLVYTLFKVQSNFADIEEYFLLIKDQKRLTGKLLEAVHWLYLESTKAKDSPVAIQSMKWLLHLLNYAQSSESIDYINYLKKFIEQYPFTEWSCLFDLILENRKKYVITSLITIFCQGQQEDPSDFLNALYCIRFLEPLVCSVYQEKIIQCLKRNREKWQVFRGTSPLDLQEDLGGLILYTLTKNQTKDRVDFDSIETAQLIFNYLNDGEENDALRMMFLGLIEEAEDREQAKITVNHQTIKDEGWITSLNSTYYLEDQLSYLSHDEVNDSESEDLI